MNKQFYYPENMKIKPKLWLWSVKDVIIVGIALIPSVISAVKLGFYIPAAVAAVYAFLTIRVDDQSVLDFMRRAVRFFITRQQLYIWKERKTGGKNENQ